MLWEGSGGIGRSWPISSYCYIKNEEKTFSKFIQLCWSSINHVVLLVVYIPSDGFIVPNYRIHVKLIGQGPRGERIFSFILCMGSIVKPMCCAVYSFLPSIASNHFHDVYFPTGWPVYRVVICSKHP